MLKLDSIFIFTNDKYLWFLKIDTSQIKYLINRDSMTKHVINFNDILLIENGNLLENVGIQAYQDKANFASDKKYLNGI